MLTDTKEVIKKKIFFCVGCRIKKERGIEDRAECPRCKSEMVKAVIRYS